jgi:hypothetical protein
LNEPHFHAFVQGFGDPAKHRQRVPLVIRILETAKFPQRKTDDDKPAEPESQENVSDCWTKRRC